MKRLLPLVLVVFVATGCPWRPAMSKPPRPPFDVDAAYSMCVEFFADLEPEGAWLPPGDPYRSPDDELSWVLPMSTDTGQQWSCELYVDQFPGEPLVIAGGYSG